MAYLWFDRHKFWISFSPDLQDITVSARLPTAFVCLITWPSLLYTLKKPTIWTGEQTSVFFIFTPVILDDMVEFDRLIFFLQSFDCRLGRPSRSGCPVLFWGRSKVSLEFFIWTVKSELLPWSQGFAKQLLRCSQWCSQKFSLPILTFQPAEAWFLFSFSVLYFSWHRYEHQAFWPNLPESDYTSVGKGKGSGFNVNLPWNKAITHFWIFALKLPLNKIITLRLKNNLSLLRERHWSGFSCRWGWPTATTSLPSSTFSYPWRMRFVLSLVR